MRWRFWQREKPQPRTMWEVWDSESANLIGVFETEEEAEAAAATDPYLFVVEDYPE